MSDPTDNYLPCPFCGIEPEHNTYFVWCSGPDDEPHGLVQLAWDRWSKRPTEACHRPAGVTEASPDEPTVADATRALDVFHGFAQGSQEPVATLKRRIDYRLNEHLCGMKPEYDDSIHGFNEAWDIVNAVFAAPPAVTEAAPEALAQSTEPKPTEHVTIEHVR